MKITICHISDIHFSENENTILEKQRKLCDAILQEALKKEIIMFIVSGDIAQSGRAKEYLIAQKFFIEIQEYLIKSKEMRVLYFFVPGNHDCDFTDLSRNMDDDLRREKLIKERKVISEGNLLYYIESLCEKQQNYQSFIGKFEYSDSIGCVVEQVYTSKLLTQYEIFIEDKKIKLNLLNSAWLTEKAEKPGYLFFLEKDYRRIDGSGSINITVYHHPSNWMHPNDRNIFNKWVMGKSDLVYVGHEHVGRNENVQTRDTAYQAQYGEVLQDKENSDNSGFILNYIEAEEKSTVVYAWDKIRKIYTVSHRFSGNIMTVDNNYLCVQKGFEIYLETPDIRITHPGKEKVTLRDLYVYPDIEAYNEIGNHFDVINDSLTVRGEELIDYILNTKRISFTGGPKSGKTALAKNIILDFIEIGKYSILADCGKLSNVSIKNLKKFEDVSIFKAYGKEYVDEYKQLPLSDKVLLLDNFEMLRDMTMKNELLDYFDNFYDYILSFSNTTFEVELLKESLYKEKKRFVHCAISELGYKKRNQLITKWYSLNDGGDIILDDLVRSKISEAMSTINVLKGNGYMPCIPPHILIILQQLECSMDGNNQERSNYGYLYEFLITKSILDMNQSCGYIHKDIAFGILTNIAEYMLHNTNKVISLDKYNNIVYQYNKDYQTDANAKQYLNEYSAVDLLEEKDGQVEFVYPYIHYYFTAKFLANNIGKEWSRNKVLEMSERLCEEECGDIMIFLCHLSKDDFIIEAVLKNAENILQGKCIFDFAEHKSINLSYEEYLNIDFIPEIDMDKRRDSLLEMQDRQEKENNKKVVSEEDSDNEQIYTLDNAFKTIEVMGQILKNYPGTIVAHIKNKLLESIYDLGMRTLAFTSDVLYGGIENIFNGVHNLQPNPSQIEMEQIYKLSNELNNSMDNLFGLLSYAMIRKLAGSVANKALMPVVSLSALNGSVGYSLMKNAVQLNEFGIISVDLILKEYEDYKDCNNVFAAKLLRLCVLDHYYVFGTKDFKNRQRVWEKLEFGNKEKQLALQIEKVQN